MCDSLAAKRDIMPYRIALEKGSSTVFPRDVLLDTSLAFLASATFDVGIRKAFTTLVCRKKAENMKAKSPIRTRPPEL
jgi:hypothetical protein